MRTSRVAVIGAGVAGLVAAIDLSRAGFDVTVFERAATPGGKMRELTVGGRPMDAGPTVFTLREVFDALFEDAGESLNDYIKLIPANVLARHAWNSHEHLDLFADLERSTDAIGSFAGSREAAGFVQFAAQARRIFSTLDASFMRASRPSTLELVRRLGIGRIADLWNIQPFVNLWQSTGRYFRDARLRQLFARYATYCGSSPFHSPATLMLVAHVEQAGVWYVEGGMHRLAQQLAAAAMRQGAKFRYATEATQIEIEDGRVGAVQVAGGDRFAVDAVVCNTDTNALAAGLFGGAVTGAAAATPRAERSLSAVTWNLVARTAGFELAHHSVFFSADYRAEFDDIFRRHRLPAAPTIYICAQDRRDPDLGDPDRREPDRHEPGREERLLCLVNAPPTGDSHFFPRSEIDACETQVFESLANYGLTVHVRPDAVVRTTPADFHRLFPATGGALYGPASHGWRASFKRPGSRSKIRGLYLAGGSAHPGPGGTHGGDLRTAGGSLHPGGLRFDRAVAPGGYAWWYIDALSDDGTRGLTLIAFIGSVFSPYYAWARRRGRRDPLNHCAFNVALYAARGGRWAMTERGAGQVHRQPTALSIGPSSMRLSGDALHVDVDERCAPLPRRLRGSIRVLPTALCDQSFILDDAGLHRWTPYAPCARVEVKFTEPAVEWSGIGYFDSNAGDEPLEDAFESWTWSRASLPGRTVVLYDVKTRRPTQHSLALEFGRDGAAHPIDVPPALALPTTGWRLPRATRADAGQIAHVVQTLEDAPFYSRSLLDTALLGVRAPAIHESLSLKRFSSPWVQWMLPFRMPRITF